jgi:AraC-like DNA-binding protein
MLVGFQKLGLAPAEICAATGARLSEAMDPAARVPASTFWALWREAERLSGDPSMGFRLAQTVPPLTATGVIAQLAAVSETGLEAIRHLARYRTLIADRLDGSLEEDDSTLSIEIRFSEVDDALGRQVYEACLAGISRMLRESSVANLSPVRVSFRHAAPPDVAPYERFFGCPVEFRALSHRLRFPLAALRQPLIAAQPRAGSRLRSLLESELRSLVPALKLAVAEQIRIALEEDERPTQTSVARRLGIGRRTLQRRLRAEGSSFRQIADHEHRSLALGMLRQSRQRVIDVAQAVGFDDATSFAKAFRRWTGESPTSYRARFLELRRPRHQ